MISISRLRQKFSHYEGPMPSKVWAFELESSTNEPGIHGDVLEQVANQSHHWTGWGFDAGRALLLFESKNDAMYAKVMVGDGK